MQKIDIIKINWGYKLSPAKIDWLIYNWCSECRNKQLKTKGIMCLECHLMMRSKPRRIDKNKKELLVIRYWKLQDIPIFTS